MTSEYHLYMGLNVILSPYITYKWDLMEYSWDIS